jgi:hypothetical protein
VKYYLKNPDFKFVRSVNIYCPHGRIVDVVVGAAKVDHPLAWDYPTCRVIPQGEWTCVQFEQPDNWSQFEIIIAADNDADIAGNISFVEPLEGNELSDFLKGKRIVFLGAARNCGDRIQGSLQKISELAELFGDYRIKVYENDSADSTLATIQSEFLGNDKCEVSSETGLDKLLSQRTQRLAYARNKLLDATLADHPDFDYVCWVDLDGLVDARFSTEGFLSNFNYEGVWDAVFPVSAPLYYDVWALRERTLAPSDLVWQMKHQIPSVIGGRKDLHTAVQQLAPGNLRGWLRVESAFGGMGIYKMACARKGRYVGLLNNEEVCEHVPYHQALSRAGARLYINPQCITHNP